MSSRLPVADKAYAGFSPTALARLACYCCGSVGIASTSMTLGRPVAIPVTMENLRYLEETGSEGCTAVRPARAALENTWQRPDHGHSRLVVGTFRSGRAKLSQRVAVPLKRSAGHHLSKKHGAAG
jgi:hypothetical protein